MELPKHILLLDESAMEMINKLPEHEQDIIDKALIEHSNILRKQILLCMARQNLKIPRQQDTAENRMQIISDVVCDYYGTTIDDIRHKSRGSLLVHKRSIISYLMRKNGIPVVRIAKFLGYKDHSSIIHISSLVTDALDRRGAGYNLAVNIDIRRDVAALEKQLEGTFGLFFEEEKP